VKFLLDHDVPDDLSYLLEQLGHEVVLLRKALPGDSSDEAVLRFAHDAGCILLTCNRDDFLHLAATHAHHGVVIIIRRRTRCDETAALVHPSRLRRYRHL
jgi:predicted nuclease of predicted toxin-antitoxin system